MKIQIDREADGRWIADIPALPGVTAYGNTPMFAAYSVMALARSVIADRLKHNEPVPKEWLGWSRE